MGEECKECEENFRCSSGEKPILDQWVGLLELEEKGT